MSSSTSAGLQNRPLRAPPPGVIPNFAHPESRASDIYIITGICMPLIIVFAVIRSYAKIVIMKKWAWDDLTFSFGMSAGLAYMSLQTSAASGGFFGVHGWDILLVDFSVTQLAVRFRKRQQLDTILPDSLVLEAIYGPFIWFVKLSLFVLYVQIFRPLRWLRYWAYTGALATGLFYFSSMITMIAMCAPKHGASSSSSGAAPVSSFCYRSMISLDNITGAVSLISDMYLVILPYLRYGRYIFRFVERLPYQQFFSLAPSSAFALAYRIQLFANDDETWNYVSLGIITDVEFTAGLTVCCMPTIAVAFQHFKNPPSNDLSSLRRDVISHTRSGAPRHYEMDSITNLQSTHINESKKSITEVTGDMQNPWSSPGQAADGSIRYSSESETHADSVLGAGRIRRTLDMDVTHHV